MNFQIESLWVWVWVLLISFWAGTVSMIRKIRLGETRFSLAQWLGELIISGFIGFMTYYLCIHADIAEPLTAVCVGVSSYMGTKSLDILSKIISSKIEKYIDKHMD